ncbi:MAG: hypothetical protein F4027_09435 [Rhodospirillaceae bacterium]|nr:hypothetical protein [Rhodospirillaceae bacterium]MYH35399.1 hypothetical protein [Rhodospirillaceae bacterium]MYK13784.1 hypothetical protein [Rhodospirillaceae bacterium]MYK58799.1 hypothetical protein [Rhodospirillaceae bacterium]
MPTVLDVLVDRYFPDANELPAGRLAAFSEIMDRLSRQNRQIEAAFEAVRQRNSRLIEALERLPSKQLQEGTFASPIRPGGALDRIMKAIAEEDRKKRRSAAEIEQSQKAHRERMEERYPDFV